MFGMFVVPYYYKNTHPFRHPPRRSGKQDQSRTWYYSYCHLPLPFLHCDEFSCCLCSETWASPTSHVFFSRLSTETQLQGTAIVVLLLLRLLLAFSLSLGRALRHRRCSAAPRARVLARVGYQRGPDSTRVAGTRFH